MSSSREANRSRRFDDPQFGLEDGAALLAAGDAVVSTDYEGLGWPGPNPYHS
jgi:hypothetical protein